jgi:hypothetical protein
MMRAMRATCLMLFVALAVAGCSSGSNGSSDGGGGGSVDLGGNPGGDMTMRMRNNEPLLTVNYTIPVGQELYRCRRVTATEDIWIKSLTPTSPAGVHHQVFAIDKSSTPPADGEGNCSVLNTNWIDLFASGVGSPSLDMPDGVALKVPAGKQMILQLHLFNATQKEITGSSTLYIERSPPVGAAHEAEVVLAGPPPVNGIPNLPSIPPGNNQKITATCRMGGDVKFFAVFPHMHQYGTHIKVWTQAPDGSPMSTVYDSDYNFSDQDFAQFAPISLGVDDKIAVECTYNNDTGSTIRLGDSSTEEMCFAISYRYPKIGNLLPGSICWDG